MSRPRQEGLYDLWKQETRKIIRKDLALIWSMHRILDKAPAIVFRFLDGVISANPFNDVSMLTWLAFGIGCTVHGFPLFWAGVVNLAVAWCSRRLIGAPRPFMFDPRLAPTTDRYQSSCGFPSLETHMATVIYGWLAWHWGQPVGWLVAILMVAFIAFSRVFSCSRFIHQVALSVVTGSIGLYWGIQLADVLRPIERKHHQLWTAGTLFLAMGLLGLCIESNDSTWTGIKKEEFVRVLGGIMDGAAEDATQNEAADDRGGGARKPGSDLEVEGVYSSANRAAKRKALRRDSFFHLQKTMERRTEEAKVIKTQVADMRRRNIILWSTPGQG